jgi:hypothetical protein
VSKLAELETLEVISGLDNFVTRVVRRTVCANFVESRTGSVFVAKPKYFANLGFAGILPDLRKILQNAQMAKFNTYMLNSKSTVPGQFLGV